jgi:UDPglucose 6-dehydrogenase
VRISVFGAGYVGLVTAACFAEVGHSVVCLDTNTDRVAALQKGQVPIYEPGLTELVGSGIASGRLKFSNEAAHAVAHGRVLVLAVGTPSQADGSVDMSQVLAAADDISKHATLPKTVVVKSTVPIGTNALLTKKFAGLPITVVSNPEFLKEGSAVADGLKPDRVIVGCDTDDDERLMRELYEPFSRHHDKLLVMSPVSAELVKYGANSMLATRISFMNELAEYAGYVGGDIEDVRRGMGADPRIGASFLYPGIGFGGSCFPKDLRALGAQMRASGIEPNIIEAVVKRNARQIDLVLNILQREIPKHDSVTRDRPVVAIWGVAFKPHTDDVREAPSLALAEQLIAIGADVRLADPVVDSVNIVVNGKDTLLSVAKSEYEAADGADALVLVTEWRQFRRPDFVRLAQVMRGRTVIDGRIQWRSSDIREAGLLYYGIGRE